MEEISQIKRFAKIHSVPIMKDEGIDFICNYIIEHNVSILLILNKSIIKIKLVKISVEHTVKSFTMYPFT